MRRDIGSAVVHVAQSMMITVAVVVVEEIAWTLPHHSAAYFLTEIMIFFYILICIERRVISRLRNPSSVRIAKRRKIHFVHVPRNRRKIKMRRN